jgi:hypothetical protein
MSNRVSPEALAAAIKLLRMSPEQLRALVQKRRRT